MIFIIYFLKESQKNIFESVHRYLLESWRFPYLGAVKNSLCLVREVISDRVTYRRFKMLDKDLRIDPAAL